MYFYGSAIFRLSSMHNNFRVFPNFQVNTWRSICLQILTASHKFNSIPGRKSLHAVKDSGEITTKCAVFV